jgi:cell division transport system permease protein
LFLHASNISNLIKEKINLIVELEDGLSNGQRTDIENFIRSHPAILPSSIHYVSKEMAIDKMQEYLEDINLDLEESPFKNVITFNVKSAYYTESILKELTDKIGQQKGVLSLYLENETVTLVKNSIQRISIISLFIGLIFIVLTLAIIYNTIKLRLHADRMEIKTMQLVGATRVFIARPYLKEAFKIAWHAFLMVSGLIAVVLLALIVNIEFFREIINWVYVGMTFVLILVVGVLLSVGIARYVVKGYLDQKMLELY